MSVCRLEAAAPNRRRHVETHRLGVGLNIIHPAATGLSGMRSEELGVLQPVHASEATNATRGARWHTGAA